MALVPGFPVSALGSFCAGKIHSHRRRGPVIRSFSPGGFLLRFSEPGACSCQRGLAGDILSTAPVQDPVGASIFGGGWFFSSARVWPACISEYAGYNGEDPPMTQFQEETQNPEGEQFHAEENPEMGAEPEYAWDPYQT